MNLMYFSCAAVAAGLCCAGSSAQTIEQSLTIESQQVLNNRQFGAAVDMDGGLLVIGDPDGFTTTSGQSGSAFVYDAGTGDLVTTLEPVGASSGDQFGHSVAIDDGTVAVGAWGDDTNGGNAGAVYIFDAMTGAQERVIIAGDTVAGDNFGWSVDIESGVVIVGARAADTLAEDAGAAYLFDAGTGARLDTLFPTDNDGDGVSPRGDFFGSGVAIGQSYAAVGASGDENYDGCGADAGAVYTFGVATGSLVDKLTAPDCSVLSEFGFSVDLDEGVLIAGAPFGDAAPGVGGSAYLFDAATGSVVAQLLPPMPTANEDFGFSVSIKGDNAVVGERRDGTGDAGAAFLYETGAGALIAELDRTGTAAFNEEFDQFGWSFAVGEGVAAVGARDDADHGGDGAVYTFAVPAGCPADLTGDGSLDFADASAFLDAFAAGDPAADFDGSGSLDFGDVSAFLDAFAAGCP